MRKIIIAPFFFVGWLGSSFANSQWGFVGSATFIAVLLGLGVLAGIFFNTRTLRRRASEDRRA